MPQFEAVTRSQQRAVRFDRADTGPPADREVITLRAGAVSTVDESGEPAVPLGPTLQYARPFLGSMVEGIRAPPAAAQEMEKNFTKSNSGLPCAHQGRVAIAREMGLRANHRSSCWIRQTSPGSHPANRRLDLQTPDYETVPATG
ncbi:aspartate aminotransferase [Lasius niger]|uniref:Aspartate aminotransferase n=1 Tax=Lasius niger TaxID=67767 RepID=A0A0J7KYP8_LASNI|nr:aspartate aminotransferase [Lasius niger]